MAAIAGSRWPDPPPPARRRGRPLFSRCGPCRRKPISPPAPLLEEGESPRRAHRACVTPSPASQRRRAHCAQRALRCSRAPRASVNGISVAPALGAPPRLPSATSEGKRGRTSRGNRPMGEPPEKTSAFEERSPAAIDLAQRRKGAAFPGAQESAAGPDQKRPVIDHEKEGEGQRRSHLSPPPRLRRGIPRGPTQRKLPHDLKGRPNAHFARPRRYEYPRAHPPRFTASRPGSIRASRGDRSQRTCAAKRLALEGRGSRRKLSPPSAAAWSFHSARRPRDTARAIAAETLRPPEPPECSSRVRRGDNITTIVGGAALARAGAHRRAARRRPRGPRGRLAVRARPRPPQPEPSSAQGGGKLGAAGRQPPLGEGPSGGRGGPAPRAAARPPRPAARPPSAAPARPGAQRPRPRRRAAGRPLGRRWRRARAGPPPGGAPAPLGGPAPEPALRRRAPRAPRAGGARGRPACPRRARGGRPRRRRGVAGRAPGRPGRGPGALGAGRRQGGPRGRQRRERAARGCLPPGPEPPGERGRELARGWRARRFRASSRAGPAPPPWRRPNRRPARARLSRPRRRRVLRRPPRRRPLPRPPAPKACASAAIAARARGSMPSASGSAATSASDSACPPPLSAAPRIATRVARLQPPLGEARGEPAEIPRRRARPRARPRRRASCAACRSRRR